MAKISSIEKNNKRKIKIEKFVKRRENLKNSIRDKSLSLEERFSLVLKLAKLPRNSASVRFRNRCSVTGRPRAVFSKMQISRTVFRQLASSGLLPGVVKASW